MKLDVVDACFIGIAARQHGKIQAGEGLVSETLMECDEHGVALPPQRKKCCTGFVEMGRTIPHLQK